MIECLVEPLSHLLMTGLIQLAHEAWQATNFAHEHPGIPYGPDWEMYQNMEMNNRLRFVAMRENGKLIGYTSIVLDTDSHNVLLLTATIRDIYVVKEKRGYAAKLVRFTESLFPVLGVKRSLIGERVQGNVSAEAFYKALGYELREKIYGKTIH